MGLVKAATNALTTRHARETSNTAIATVALHNSALSLDAIGKGGIKNNQRLAQVVPMIGGKKGMDQAAAQQLEQQLAKISNDAAWLKRMKPVILEAAKDYVQAEKDRGDIAVAVGGAMQKAAVANSSNQRKLFNGHADAAVTTNWNQAAYGGSNFSV